MTEATKRCGKCRECKPRSAFHRANGQPDGLQHRCKVCMRQTVNDNYRRREGLACSECGVLKLKTAFAHPRDRVPVCRLCEQSAEAAEAAARLSSPKPKLHVARPGRTQAESEQRNEAAIAQLVANTAAALGV
jgi:hypothetical protein